MFIHEGHPVLGGIYVFNSCQIKADAASFQGPTVLWWTKACPHITAKPHLQQCCKCLRWTRLVCVHVLREIINRLIQRNFSWSTLPPAGKVTVGSQRGLSLPITNISGWRVAVKGIHLARPNTVFDCPASLFSRIGMWINYLFNSAALRPPRWLFFFFFFRLFKNLNTKEACAQKMNPWAMVLQT